MFALTTHLVIAGLLFLSQQEQATVIHPPHPMTRAEEERAGTFALHHLHDRFLPMVARDSGVFHLEGISMKGARIGEPFLDITLRDRSIDDYANSSENDPRLFASLFKYCFPVYIAARQGPIIFIVVLRNYDRDRDTVFSDEGEFTFFGYYFAGPGMTQSAATLRKRHGGRVSFVEFIDTAIPRRVIIDGASGLRSGVDGDSLITMQADAKKIKRYVLWQRDY